MRNRKGYPETSFGRFYDLMPYHIREILLVSSLYDYFIMEEDGLLTERMFGEYMGLQLTFPPRITRVSTAKEALEALRKRRFDLVITMSRIPDMDPFDFGVEVKRLRPNKPVLMFALEVAQASPSSIIPGGESGIDRVFLWTGDTKVLLASVKSVEDHLNVRHDSRKGNVRVIILVENDPRDYSTLLPVIYTEIWKQTRALIETGLNEMERFLRMRARPKVLLATTYEEGLRLFDKYRPFVLGVISDMAFPRQGKDKHDSGLVLIDAIRRQAPDLPILLLSADPENATSAVKLGVVFLDKNSDTLLMDLRRFMKDNFGFGDFVFRTQDGHEVARATNLPELEAKIARIPTESLLYHAERNHFSTWLMARGKIGLAEALRPVNVGDFDDPEDVRALLVDALGTDRAQVQQGIIANFSRHELEPEGSFVHLGTGSLGGKARGLAFIGKLLARTNIQEEFEDVKLSVPRTAAVLTGDFEAFLVENNLEEFALHATDDEEIMRRFRKARLPSRLVSDLDRLVNAFRCPLAVRSSSLLEDSYDRPLAGLYSTYMLPNNHPDRAIRLRQLCIAIKAVYASMFLSAPRAYLETTPMRLEEEKMGVVVQELVGRRHGDRFYPDFSGVARSYNYYPIARHKPDEGIVFLALGLGKLVVEGGNVLKFCPRHPRVLPQLAVLDNVLESTQRNFYALNTRRKGTDLSMNQEKSILRLDLTQAEKDGTLGPVGSVVCWNDRRLRDGIRHRGPRVVTFASVLQHGALPLAAILTRFLELAGEGVGGPVEIEFAGNIGTQNGSRREVSFLQVRPQVAARDAGEVDLDVDRDDALCVSCNTQGHGVIDNIRDIVFVAPDRFDRSATARIAGEIGRFNHSLAKKKHPYLLIGPGRWGTADPWLGIPVTWDQISGARVIVEARVKDFVVDPSHGSHFFHNITALKMGYLSIHGDADFVDWDWLEAAGPGSNSKHVRHVRLPRPVEVRLDGRLRCGLILKEAGIKKRSS